jgi:hypothetical protein
MMDWLRDHWEPLVSFLGGIFSSLVLLWRHHTERLKEVDARYDRMTAELQQFRAEQAAQLSEHRVQLLQAIRDERESIDRDTDHIRQRIDNLQR